MTCEIISKSDFLTGATLTVLVPEEDLDIKALYTVQADMPDFILPFRSRSIDGKVELVYQIGRQSKLRYIAGIRKPGEYAQIWSGILSPLLYCGDWFMKPYSFALSAEFLFFDKATKSVSYVYVPTLNDCADYSDLKEMAAEISRLIPVADAILENRVLRAIMKNFNPQEFMKMLKAYMEEELPIEPHPTPQILYGPQPPNGYQTLYGPQPPHATQPPHISPVGSAGRGAQAGCFSMSSGAQPAAYPLASASLPPGSGDVLPAVPGDVFINLPTEKNPSKKDKENAKIENRTAKEEKDSEKPGSLAGLFNKKKTPQSDASGGKKAAPAASAAEAAEPCPGVGIEPVIAVTHPVVCAEPVNAKPINGNPVNTAPVIAEPEKVDDATQCIDIAAGGTRFTYTGRGQMPPVIYVPIKQGEVFTVGRYDTAVGRAQSNFEFDKKTKAVSRRHAAIERCAEEYKIIDLTSSAGTFINGKKLPPNTPVGLEHGCRVSFGNSGADYIWEE